MGFGQFGFCVFFLFCAFWIPSASAQAQIEGRIVDPSFQGIADISVSYDDFEVTTDDSGYFSIAPSSTSIRPITQHAVLNSKSEYRIFVPNGARRLLPIQHLEKLPNGIYYLVPGRFYSSRLQIILVDGKIQNIKNIRSSQQDSQTSAQLTKTALNQNIALYKEGTIDTLIPVSTFIQQGAIMVESPLNSANTTPVQDSLAPTQTKIIWGSFVDPRDQYEYRTVHIDTLEWFAENLRYTSSESYCYQYSDSLCSIYGRLYNWASAMDIPQTYNTKDWPYDSMTQGACPEGWRLPSQEEWLNLEATAGMNELSLKKSGWRGNSGHSLMAENAWEPDQGTNSVGFSALPSGTYYHGYFYALDQGAYFWSREEGNLVSPSSDQLSKAKARILLASQQGVNSNVYSKASGFSVRCVRLSALQACHNNQCDSLQNQPDSSTNTNQDSSQIDPQDTLDLFDSPNSNLQYGEFLDQRDQQLYQTITIDSLEWMAENLRYKQEGSFCYLDSLVYCEIYGRLYSWPQAMNLPEEYMTLDWPADTLTNQGICPQGWRLPTNADWDNLEAAVGLPRTSTDRIGWRGQHATTLKALQLWDPNDGTNTFGFSAIPAGTNQRGSYESLGKAAHFWTSNEGSPLTPGSDHISKAWARVIVSSQQGLNRDAYPKGDAYSVRCVRANPFGNCSSIKRAAPRSQWPTYCQNSSDLCGTFFDSQSCQEYRWVKIGEQIWMAENLNRGTMISGTQQQTKANSTEKYCYDNDENNCVQYGGLYQWREAMALPDSCSSQNCENLIEPEHQGICPEGWAVPSRGAWARLMQTTSNATDSMMAEGEWSNTGTDTWGFSGISAGGLQIPNQFMGKGTAAGWWANSELTSQQAWGHGLIAGQNEPVKDVYNKSSTASSLRCVKKGTTHGVFWEKWRHIASNQFSAIPMTTIPDSTFSSDSLVLGDIGIYSGFKAQITLKVPETNSYTFAVYGDDKIKLTISKSGNQNPNEICSSPDYTGYKWDKYPSQQSKPINLIKGETIKLTTIGTNGIGSSYFGVGWTADASANNYEIIHFP